MHHMHLDAFTAEAAYVVNAANAVNAHMQYTQSTHYATRAMALTILYLFEREFGSFSANESCVAMTRCDVIEHFVAMGSCVATEPCVLLRQM